MHIIKKITGLLLVSLICACGATHGRTAKLKESIFYFNEGVRWGRLQDVLTRLDPSAQEEFLKSHEGFGSELLVTGYEIVSTQFDTNTSRATVGVKITWYRLNQMEVHETTLAQTWEERKGTWLVIAEEYRAGKAFYTAPAKETNHEEDRPTLDNTSENTPNTSDS